MSESYAAGAGEIPPFETWWCALQEDPDYDPDLCFAGENADTKSTIAFAQCWIGGFIKDVAVAPSQRRLGIGRALIQEVFVRFAARGCNSVDLKVVAGNSDAIAFYKSIGMEIV